MLANHKYEIEVVYKKINSSTLYKDTLLVVIPPDILSDVEYDIELNFYEKYETQPIIGIKDCGIYYMQ